MKYQIITYPTIEPVTVEECRQFIGVFQAGDNSRDEIIKYRIKVARLWCEEFSKYTFMQQTMVAYADSFCECCQEIRLRAPLKSVSSIIYIDQNGVDITLSPDDYYVDLLGNSVVPAYGKAWPLARCQRNSVRITFVSGESDRAQVDERIKEAIRFIVGQWERYQNTLEGGGYPPDFPNVAKSLLSFCVDYGEVF